MDEHGEKTALLIDLKKPKQSGSNEMDVMEFIEYLEDVLAIELAKSENDYSYRDEAKNSLRTIRVID